MNTRDWDRIANDYYSEIISPLKNSAENPLFKDIASLPDTYTKVIDLGCGLGELACTLSGRFQDVVGIDFSQNMIEKAQQKNKNLSNVTFACADMRNLSKYKDRFDVAIAVNSILTTDIKDLNLIFKQIHGVIKTGGMFFAILPSMEVYLYQTMLLTEKELRKGKTQNQALKKAMALFPEHEHNFITGCTNFDGDRQKNFYRFEIIHRLQKAGFADIKVGKVLYPWKEFSKAGQSYHPKENPPWDWYVSCKKNNQ